MSFKQVPSFQAGTIVQVQSLSDLPTDEAVGGVRYVIDTISLYAYNGSSWDLIATGGEATGVIGPDTTTDNALMRWDGALGTLAANSGVLLDDSNNMSGVGTLGLSGPITDTSQTASRAVVTNGSKAYIASATTATELGYVHGVTSAIQTQLDSKQATITGGATTIASSDLATSKALISNGSGKVAVSAVTSTELGYLSGVTTPTGSGALVLATSPALVTPALGIATATSLNGLTITSTTGTLTLVNGSTLATAGAYSTTLTATADTDVTLPTTGTLATLAGSETFTNKTLTSPKVNENVALTSTATKLNYLTSAGGTTGTTSTNIVFSTSPTLVTPTLGVATATSINKVAVTAPSSSATLTLADGSTLATSGAYSTTLTATGATNVTLPTTGTLATLAGSEALTGKTYNGLTVTSSTGTLTIANGKTLTASNTLTFTGTDSSSVAFGAGGTVQYTALTDGKLHIGNSSNIATEVTLTGDVTVSNAGVTAIASGVIVNADINASAAIAGSKIVTASGSTAGVVDGNAQSFSGVKTFSNGIAFANETLDTYDELSSTATGTVQSGAGSISSGTATFTYVLRRIGKLVAYSVRVSGTYGITGNVFAIGFTTPAGFAPTTSQGGGLHIAGTDLFYQPSFGASIISISKKDRTGAAVTFAANADTDVICGAYIID